ncbi:MAG: hypothetical protein ABW080_19765 [Candidatus Thiodiazotropha sp.]
MDKETFKAGMAYLVAAYGMELSKQRAAVYWDQLGSLDGELFREAVKAHVGHCRRFPTVAELRENYRGALRRRSAEAAPRLVAARPADREKVRSLLRGLSERMRP